MKQKIWPYLLVVGVLVFVFSACAPQAPEESPAEQPSEETEEPTEAEPTEAASEAPKETAETASEEPEATDAPVEEPHAVKIGVLYPTTGGFAVFGEQATAGTNLYFDNHPIDGVEVELVYADTAGDPQQALEQARRLVEQEEVDLLTGLINSAVAVPVAQYADEAQVPLAISIAGARAVTEEGSSPYVYRTGLGNGQQDGPLGWYTASELGLQRAAVFAWDFLVGQERGDAFAQTFEAAGGEVVTVVRPPLGTTDYGPFLGEVNPADIDVIYAFFAGPGAIGFVQQLLQFGFTPALQVVASDYFTAGVLGSMGPDAEGLVQAGGWVTSVDTPENEEFLQLFDEQVGGEPGVYVEEAYTSAQVIANAIEAAGGDLSDPQPFLDALAALDASTPAGPLSFDDNGQAVRTIYITQVGLNDEGAPVQEVLSSIEEVDLSWSPE